ncbi:hypothetical protein Tco_1455263 [Tanacetum coccineum]
MQRAKSSNLKAIIPSETSSTNGTSITDIDNPYEFLSNEDNDTMNELEDGDKTTSDEYENENTDSDSPVPDRIVVDTREDTPYKGEFVHDPAEIEEIEKHVPVKCHVSNSEDSIASEG